MLREHLGKRTPCNDVCSSLKEERLSLGSAERRDMISEAEG